MKVRAATREELDEQIRVLIQYLRMKTDVGDFHAVQDAAVDIREIQAKLEVLNMK